MSISHSDVPQCNISYSVITGLLPTFCSDSSVFLNSFNVLIKTIFKENTEEAQSNKKPPT